MHVVCHLTVLFGVNRHGILVYRSLDFWDYRKKNEEIGRRRERTKHLQLLLLTSFVASVGKYAMNQMKSRDYKSDDLAENTREEKKRG